MILINIITNPAAKYIIAIRGTNFEVTLAIDLIPPIITNPKIIEMMSPNNQPLSAKKDPSPPVTDTNC